MPDSKTKRGVQDRRLVARAQPYEVAYFAKKHGLTLSQARAIIRKHGPSRTACDAAASRFQSGNKSKKE